MLVLLETSGGFALFRLKKASKLMAVEDVTEIQNYFAEASSAQKFVELAAFSKFRDNKQAMEECLSLMESTVGKGLKKFLKKHVLSLAENAQLVVADKALGAAIRSKLGIDVVFTPHTHEIIRGIKSQLDSLLENLTGQGRQQMAMSLSHSLNRFKLRFSPEKLDTMIIQAVALLEDLDRELNNFAMRLKEWYGWHFPELSRVVPDNLVYAKLVKMIGFRTNTKHAALDELLPEDIASEVRMSAETSMGTEMTSEDLSHIHTLASRVEELVEYRANLAEYLKVRMTAIAPNLTHMVGEVIGARLMAHSGSLLNLSKQPASTIQILGAEKALFRALKTKSNTPKYGLIYHAALVGQAPPKLKGKVSRVLAAKLSLCVRVDALTEATISAATAAGAKSKEEPQPAAAMEPTVALACRRYVEQKLQQFENKLNGDVSKPTTKPALARYEPQRTNGGYDATADFVGQKSKKSRDEADVPKTEKPHKQKKIKTETA